MELSIILHVPFYSYLVYAKHWLRVHSKLYPEKLRYGLARRNLPTLCILEGYKKLYKVVGSSDNADNDSLLEESTEEVALGITLQMIYLQL